MCGIASVLGLSGIPLEERKKIIANLEHSSKKLEDRGPDESGQDIDQEFMYAQFHKRRSLVGARSGAQPIIDDEISLAINGEIYNHKDLQTLPELKNAKFKTGSDCEVIIHLYRAFGIHFLRRLEGMFAFTLIDKQNKKVFIARDNISICPLYMACGPNGSTYLDRDPKNKDSKESKDIKVIDDPFDKSRIYFQEPIRIASDLTEKKLIPCGPSIKMVSSYLQVLQEQDINRCMHIQQVESGCLWYGDLETGAGDFVKWYDEKWMDANFEPLDRSEKECIEDLRDTITDAFIKVHDMIDPELMETMVCPLSAGIDSSSLVAALSIHRKKKGLPPLHTCSTGIISEKGEILSPDVLGAREVATIYGTRHREFLYKIEEVVNEKELKKLVSTTSTFWSTLIRASVCMDKMARDLKKLGFKVILSGSTPDELLGYLYMRFAPNFRAYKEETIRKIVNLGYQDNLRETMIYGSHGLEVRVPYALNSVIDCIMLRIPTRHKVCGLLADGRIEKWILRQAFAPYLPESTVNRIKISFSDGQSSSVIDSIEALAASKVTDEMMSQAAIRFPFNPPQTKEVYLYRTYFDELFSHPSAARTVFGGCSIGCSSQFIEHWHPSFKSVSDDSARKVMALLKSS